MIAALLAVALAGNLHIEDLTPCSGEEIPPGTQVTVHYTGRVQGGEVFDSSLERGEPITVPLGRGVLIEGWDIGMQGMSVGCKRRLTIPPELGYGDRKVSRKLPPGSTLIFDIELLSLEAGRPLPPAQPRPAPMYLTTDSGLQYFDFRAGTGDAAVAGKRATVEYTLWLADGTLVDSSFKRAKPLTYRVGRGQVIAGWEEAVMGMQVGGVRQFRVPWKLGYGRGGHPPIIPPKAELVFEVELMSVD